MYFRSGIQSIDGLSVLGDSKLCIIAFTSDKFHVYKIADEMKVHTLPEKIAQKSNVHSPNVIIG